MSDDTLTLRYSQILNQLVIDFDSTEEVGYVDALLVNVKQARVEGIVCKTGFLGREKQTFVWAQLSSIGQDSLMVHASVAPSPASNPVPNPTSAHEALTAAQPMIGLEVWTDTGNKAGHIADFELNRKTGEIEVYLYAEEGIRELTDGLYGLYPDSILSAGRKRIMVTAGAVDRAERYADGLHQKAAQAADFIKSDYEQTRQDWTTWKKGAQSLADKLQQQTLKLKDYTQEHLPELTDQLHDKTRQVRKQVNKQVSEVQDRLHDSTLPTPFSRPKVNDPGKTIDIQSFEVWEDEGED